jgi:hypothetical protein
MARERTGTLLPAGKDGSLRARIAQRNADGSLSRPYYSLGTTDRALAQRRLRELVDGVAKGLAPESAALLVAGVHRAPPQGRGRARAGVPHPRG